MFTSISMRVHQVCSKLFTEGIARRKGAVNKFFFRGSVKATALIITLENHSRN